MKPPLSTGTPSADWPGPSPAATPARVPPVPQGRATTSGRGAASASSRPSSAQPRTAAALLPPSGTSWKRPNRSRIRWVNPGPCRSRYSARETKCSTIPSAAQRASESFSGRSASSSPRTTPTVRSDSSRPAAAVARRWLE